MDHTDQWAGTRPVGTEGAARLTVPPAPVSSASRTASAAWSDRRTGLRRAPPERRPRPVVHGVFLDGDRLVSGWAGRQTARLRGGHRHRRRPRRDGTVVFATRRDLYGRSVHLATAVYTSSAPGIGAAAAGASRSRRDRRCRHRLRVLPVVPMSASSTRPPRADDELGACAARPFGVRGRPPTRPDSGTSRPSPGGPRPTPARGPRGVRTRTSLWPGGSSTTATGRLRTHGRS